MIRAFCLAIGVLGCAALAAACSSADAGGGSTDGTTGNVFLAFSTSFQPFRTWDSFHLDTPFDGGSVHASGPRTEYLSQRPAKGSTEFPVGTIIVKVLETPPARIFAMVKRGGDYNTGGATNWEWFELSEDAQGAVSIIWRGVGAPAGEQYGGDPTTCNVCHSAAKTNDFVRSSALQLGAL